jgi:hypothetical protein
MGLGMHHKMVNDSSHNFREHLSAQIELFGIDPFFRGILGIALYVPVYLSFEDQKLIDGILKKYFSPT